MRNDVDAEDDDAGDKGDVWTWTALDADSKLIVSYLVGQRGPSGMVTSCSMCHRE